MKLKLLDLFAGVGGAGAGYEMAGFDITAVDNRPQPNNPHRFIQADALEYLKKHGHEFDVIHASPPCQKYSNAAAPARALGVEYPDLIPELRELLIEIGVPYIIENVPSAPLRKDIRLQGTMFGLNLLKKRVFELGNGLFLMKPTIGLTNKSVKNGDFCQVVGKGQLKPSKCAPFKHCKGNILDTWRDVTQVHWGKTYSELANAIPPAYTEWIGVGIYSQVFAFKKSKKRKK